nr:hypothetical protein GCM10020185_69030 [Pseudomonas brassicacearum subsp. brassicacearum]
MQAIRSILVVIEPEHSESLALKRAKLIAGVTQAHLHLLVCDKKHDHAGLLSVLKAALLADGYSVTTEQAWNESLHETIIDVQQAEGCGLVIKQHFPDSPLKKSPADPGRLEAATPLPDAGAAGENRRFLERQGDPGRRRRWQCRWRASPLALHHHRSWL